MMDPQVYITSDGVETVARCCNPKCLRPFVPRDHRQRTCGASKCRDSARDVTPARRLLARHRNREWAKAHRGVKASQPWLLGAPIYPAHLPGGGCEIDVRPRPRWRVEHRNVRALHGAITVCLDEPHDERIPGFSLVPWPCGLGWGVYVRSAEAAARIAGKTMHGRLFDVPVDFEFSPLRRLRAPVVAKRGHGRVRIDTVTPVVIRSRAAPPRTEPTASCIISALTQAFPARIGLDGFDPATVRLELVSHETRPDQVDLGGKFGRVVGWSGSCVVDANAVGRWLLAVAALVGLGGRTSLGFGRVRVTHG